jgi:hypothetical protein
MQVEHAENRNTKEDTRHSSQMPGTKQADEKYAGSRVQGACDRQNERSPGPRADCGVCKHFKSDDN